MKTAIHVSRFIFVAIISLSVLYLFYCKWLLCQVLGLYQHFIVLDYVKILKRDFIM